MEHPSHSNSPEPSSRQGRWWKLALLLGGVALLLGITSLFRVGGGRWGKGSAGDVPMGCGGASFGTSNRALRTDSSANNTSTSPLGSTGVEQSRIDSGRIARQILFLESNVDNDTARQVGVAPTNDGLVVLTQKLRFYGSQGLYDAYLRLNGKTIEGVYDFREQKLLFSLTHGKTIFDGLQRGFVAVMGDQGHWSYRSLAFRYSGSPATVSIAPVRNGYQVKVSDADGFQKIEVSGSSLGLQQPIQLKSMTFEHTFVVPVSQMTSNQNNLQVTASAPRLVLQSSRDELVKNSSLLFPVGSAKFLQSRQLDNESGNQWVCEPVQEKQDPKDVALAQLQNLSKHIQQAQTSGTSALLPASGLTVQDLSNLQHALGSYPRYPGRDCNDAMLQSLNQSLSDLQGKKAKLEQELANLKSGKQQLEQQSNQAIQNARNALTSANQDVGRLKNELQQASQKLNSAAQGCHQFFVSLPGASPTPTGSYISSDRPDSEFGGRVHLSDPTLFLQSISTPTNEKLAKNCRDKINNLAALAETATKALEQAEVKQQQAQSSYDSIVAQQQSALRTAQQKINEAQLQLEVLQPVLAKLLQDIEICKKSREAMQEEQKRQEAAEKLRQEQQRELQQMEQGSQERTQREQEANTQDQQQSSQSANRSLEQERREQRRKKKRAQEILENAKPKKILDEPVEATDDQIKMQAKGVFKNLYYDATIQRCRCNCVEKALALSHNTNSVVSDVLGQLALDIAFAPLEALEFGLAAKIGLGMAKAIGKSLYGADISDELTEMLFSNIGGELFPTILQSDFAGTRTEQLVTAGTMKVKDLLEKEQLRTATWEGQTSTERCKTIKGKTFMLVNVNTGWAVFLIQVDGCSVVMVKYRIKDDGVPAKGPKWVKLLQP
ncbi:MAG: hypothetical protein EP343_08915 [Deltaproteobacteria bacterium]|nr:MAG: hypothetical protein EP343_08915 [Deltaproteobacteria bacterium]